MGFWKFNKDKASKVFMVQFCRREEPMFRELIKYAYEKVNNGRLNDDDVVILSEVIQEADRILEEWGY